MADRRSFLLRIDPGVLEAVQRWANDDLRSLNGQVEYVLREALRRAGRVAGARAAAGEGDAQSREDVPPAGPEDPTKDGSQ